MNNGFFKNDTIDQVSIVGSLPKAAGKTNATTVDQAITATDTFNSIALVNDGPNELIIAINESTETATNLFYIANGEPFSRNLTGVSLHHKVIAGSATFRYDLV